MQLTLMSRILVAAFVIASQLAFASPVPEECTSVDRLECKHRAYMRSYY